MKTKLKKLIMCPGIPRSGTTSLWKMLYDSKIVEGLYKEFHYLSIMHNHNYDPIYPLELFESHKKYIIHQNQKIGLSQPYNFDNYLSYLNSQANPSDFSQSYFLLPENYLRKINENLRDHFDIKIILIYREPIQRLISYINMLHYGAGCFGIKPKEKNDLFLDYVNNPKMQTLYKDVKDKFERVFENVICLTTEHFFINQQKQDELKKFLEVSEIKALSKPQNVANFNFELHNYYIELANTKLKESIDFYTTLLP